MTSNVYSHKYFLYAKGAAYFGKSDSQKWAKTGANIDRKLKEAFRNVRCMFAI